VRGINMKNYKIAKIGGDGTGPEVVREAVKVVDSAGKKFDFKVDWHEKDYGGDRYLKTGKVLDEEDLEDLKQYKAILLGAIGHPDVKPGILEKGILLNIRFSLQQYVNLRPVILYSGVETPLKDKGPEDIDFVVVRENNWGIYGGNGGIMFKDTDDEVATQEMIYTAKSVDQCLRFAFEHTKNRGKDKKLTYVGKTNVLTYVCDLWDRRFHKMAEEYPDVETDYAHVDATCMWMVKNPEWFDVIVTPNMFGDIITDLGAMVQGGMGIAAGANINPEGSSMFEPIGGSAPKYTGKNVINPLASIESARMMLEYLGEHEAGEAVKKAVSDFLKSGKLKGLSAKAVKESGLGTREIGDIIAESI
jgi:3-isopropylmalate dehydrogenase